MSEKQAFIFPDAAQALALTQKYLPPSLLIGGGAAGLQHLLAMNAEQKKNEEEAGKNKDLLTVEIPMAKAAARGRWQPPPVVQDATILGHTAGEAAGHAAPGAGPSLADAALAEAAALRARIRASRAAATTPPAGDPNAIFGSPAAAAPSHTAGAPPPLSTTAPPGMMTGQELHDSIFGVPPAAAAPRAAGAPPSATGGGASPPNVPPVASASPASGGGGSAPSLSQAVAGGANPPGFFKNHWGKLLSAAGLTAAGGAAVEHGAIKSEGSPSLLDASLGTALISGGLMGGYSLVNHFIKERRRKAMQEQLDQAKGEYSRLLGQTLSKSAGLDSVVEFPFIHGICSAFAESGGLEKTAATSPGMMLAGSPGILAVLSGIAAHRWMYNRQNELEKLYTAKKPEPPKQIRLVSTPAPDAEQDDDQPLALGAPEPEKIAGVSAGEILGMTGRAVLPMLALGAAGHLAGRAMDDNTGAAIGQTAGLLAGVPLGAMWNKNHARSAAQKQRKELSEKKDLTDQDRRDLEYLNDPRGGNLGTPEKVAGLAEILEFVKSPEAVEIEKEKEDLRQPHATKVAPGTVQISTPGGSSTEIEATDPATAKILARNTPRLTKLLAAYQSTPMMAA